MAINAEVADTNSRTTVLGISREASPIAAHLAEFFGPLRMKAGLRLHSSLAVKEILNTFLVSRAYSVLSKEVYREYS
jgi:hypothetical protein